MKLFVVRPVPTARAQATGQSGWETGLLTLRTPFLFSDSKPRHLPPRCTPLLSCVMLMGVDLRSPGTLAGVKAAASPAHGTGYGWGVILLTHIQISIRTNDIHSEVSDVC